MTDFKMIDGERKQLFDRICTTSRNRFSRWEIGAAVGIERHMHDGLLENDFVERQFGAKERPDLQPGDDVVDMGERNIVGRFTPANGDAAHLRLQAKWNSV